MALIGASIKARINIMDFNDAQPMIIKAEALMQGDYS